MRSLAARHATVTVALVALSLLIAGSAGWLVAGDQIESLLGAAVLAVAGVISGLAVAQSLRRTRRQSNALRTLTGVVDQATLGNFDQSVQIQGFREISELAAAIDRLIGEMREQREIAGYVCALARAPRANAREDGSASASSVLAPPRSGPALVLALEWRSGRRESEHDAVTALEQWLPILVHWATGFGARLVSGGSTRIYLVFELAGEPGLQHCLSGLLAECLTRTRQPAMALASGKLISAGIDLGQGRTSLISGKPVFHCERLLAEAGAGRLLLSPAAYRQLETGLKRLEARTVLSKGLVSQRNFYQLVRLQAAKIDADSANAGDHPGQHLPVGTMIGNRYDILEPLGQGSVGAVYRAHDRTRDVVVALKIIKPSVTGNAASLERLWQRLRTVSRVVHTNVVAVQEPIEIEGLAIVPMEYVRGITLRRFLDRSSPINRAAGLRICIQILRGLDAMHQAQLVHWNLKPENIILDQAGNARLTEPGLPAPDMSVPDQAPPSHLAPETLHGDAADHRSDLYALGVILREMFDEDELLEPIIQTCLARHPEARYPDASTLLAHLARVRRSIVTTDS